MTAQVDLLAGVYAKIGRASKHLADFREATHSFLESEPFTFIHQQNPSMSSENVGAEHIEPVPTELSLLFGDAIHNLRSALDFLACQLVRLNISNHKCKDISFPIYSTSEDFMNKLDNNTKLMVQPAKSIIEQLQPYKHGKGHKLWIIHQLDIQDKHRLLVVLPPSINSWTRTITSIPMGTDSLPIQSVDEVSLPADKFFTGHEGAAFDSLDLSDILPGKDVEHNIAYRLNGDIAIDEPGIVQNQSAFATLQDLAITTIKTVEVFRQLF